MAGNLEAYAAAFQLFGAVCLLFMLKGSAIPGKIALAMGYIIFSLSSWVRVCACGQQDWRFVLAGFLFLLAALLFVIAARKIASSDFSSPEGRE
ncbi:MAG: hypothetical protein PHD82_11730 [Candidatus Riflebacteria bacterium]|nr:hypothetical protein [Candidatus Riflebacteria bacterium]